MKRLLLLRHAKSDRTTSLGDRDRPLAARGRRDAPAMGKFMHRHALEPDRVLCSGAKRTRQTWTLVARELKSEPTVEISGALYLAPWNAIVNVLHETPRAAKTLLVIGHNPGLEDCAAALLRPQADAEERARRATMAEKFPTAALAVLDCDVANWNELEPGTAGLTDFIRPRDL